ncbi:MAG: VanZ family protein [Anaerolineaceae bacterium]|nr:VanZ family protein [Anaerolineaceae bacterium]
MRKTGILLTAAVIAAILHLTLMSPEATMALSENVRSWLMDNGINFTNAQLRSDVHVVEYMPLGFVLCIWLGWKKSAVTGSLLGLSDEVFKIFLPTREFSGIDFSKDIIGVMLGAALYIVFSKLILSAVEKARKKRKTGKIAPDCIG